MTEAVLHGEPGTRRDVVLLNAAAALLVAGVVGRSLLLGQRVPTGGTVPEPDVPDVPAELPAGARDQDAGVSLAERIGDRVLQSRLTRESSQAIPCSSGSAGSYSSVTG